MTEPSTDPSASPRTRRRTTLRRRLLYVALVVGVLSFTVGVGGLDIARSRVDHVAKIGIHVTAKVVEADTYDNGYRYKTRLVVTFPTKSGSVQRTRVWIGYQDYFVGQSVGVVYDPASPSTAQLEAPDAQIGPNRLPLLLASLVGAGFLLYVAGGLGFWLIRRLIT